MLTVEPLAWTPDRSARLREARARAAALLHLEHARRTRRVPCSGPVEPARPSAPVGAVAGVGQAARVGQVELGLWSPRASGYSPIQ